MYLDTNSLSDVGFTNASRSVGSFPPLVLFLHAREFLSLMKACLIFPFVGPAFAVLSKNASSRPRS